ncbi:MAG: hypothetical protein IT318_21515, partial [Anaerolineales bacterium]|nr:hypothetical protein [Anaerolineales bacterium]
MRPITDVYVTLAERIAVRLGSPRVRSLHLPPPAGAKHAEFCALELDDGSIGFSYIQLEGTEAPLRERGGRGLPGLEAAALARGFAGADPVARALGFAAINALSQQLFARAGWAPSARGDSLGTLDPRPGEHIGMVGLFPPLLPAIERSGARLTVLELNRALVGAAASYRVTLDPAELASCDQVVSTCTVLLNDTLDDVLAACRGARRFTIVGPTASCVPDPLFARGVAALGGRRVADGERLLQAFGHGEKWGAYARKYVLAREDYPGIEQL